MSSAIGGYAFIISTDRWTCPHPLCRETVTVQTRAALRRVQTEHAIDHPAPKRPGR